MATPPVTLLFAHANGLCKEVWEPVVRRIRQSALLQDLSMEFAAYDQPYQGANRDESQLGEVYFKDDNPARPRVKHPINNVSGEFLGAAQRQIERLGGKGRLLIGIGHSIGATALWATETKHPGTFDGLILFEPIHGESAAVLEKSIDLLVFRTLARPKKWPNLEVAAAYFANGKIYASWDRESLACYVKGGVIFDEAQQAAVLACHPHVEAGLYCGSRLSIPPSELAAPKCQVVIYSGSRTRLFDREAFERITKSFPNIYTNREPMLGTSHLMVVEDPEATSRAIVAELKELECLKAARL